MKKSHRKVERRNDKFADKIVTKIWKEVPSENNPYIAVESYCHGYKLMDLMEKRSFSDVFFLLFQGDLPSRQKSDLLEKLMIAFISPRPRHPATRTALLTAVGKADLVHILPNSLITLGGDHSGSGEIEGAMRFFRKNQRKDPGSIIRDALNQEKPTAGDWRLVPGFGSRFGGIDQEIQTLAAHFASLPGAGPALSFGEKLAKELKPHKSGWLATGLVAATLSDLGFHPKAGPGLYQILSAPGLFAHGVEFANRPLTAVPFPDDEDYFFEE